MTDTQSDGPGAASGETRTITAPADDERLDRMLAAALGALSRSRVKALIEQGCVRQTADGAGATITDPNFRVKRGQTFAIFIPEVRPASPEAQPIALEIVYEDDALIVVDKPAGLVVHPAPGNAEGTLVNALLAHCGDSLSGIGGVRRPGIVHRLDKDTSGLLVAAKTDAAHRALTEQFAAHTIERAYLALVWGVPQPRAGEIEGNIGRSAQNRKKMAVVVGRGRAALTRYRVLRSFGTALSLVECRLATGRTHQIRVHMAHIGHAVVGDPLYGGSRRARRAMLGEATAARIAGLGRQALHAATLGFDHPTSGETMKFESELSSDISSLIDYLE